MSLWIVSTLKKLSDIGKQAVNWDRTSLAQVAFVCSEETPMYQAEAMNGENGAVQNSESLPLATRRSLHSASGRGTAFHSTSMS